MNPFALVAGLISLGMLKMYGAIWLQLRSGEPIASRAKHWAKLTGIATIGAIGLTGIWLSIGISGFKVVSMRPVNAIPNPLTEEVVAEGAAWLANYWNIP